MADSIVVDPDGEAVAASPEPQTPPEPEVKPEDELPEKYRGKSMQDLIEMHRNAEAELGHKKHEIGLVRKLADELIGIRAAEQQAGRTNPPEAVKPLTTDSLFEDPEAAILGVVKREAVSRTEALEKSLRQIESDLQLEKFEKKHPGFQQTMTSPEFGAFVQASPYRSRLALKASQGDFEAADELFGLYEDRPQQAPQAPQSSGVEQARKASLAKSGGSSASGVVPSGAQAPIFTRAELMEMRIKRPEEFDQRQEEILQAYREKRVR